MFLYVVATLKNSTIGANLTNLICYLVPVKTLTLFFTKTIPAVVTYLPFFYLLAAILAVRVIFTRKCTTQASTINNVFSKN